jgi:ribosomal protein S18 acetylase RimI-like enzyme
MELILREAAEADLPAILCLYAQLGQDDGSVLELQEAAQIFKKMKSYPDYRIHIAVLDQNIVGIFSLLVMDNLGHRGAPSAILEDVVVEKKLRGMGIGNRMMGYAHDLCREKGCYKMTFSSNLNREAAHRFYESLGFSRHGYSFFINYN